MKSMTPSCSSEPDTPNQNFIKAALSNLSESDQILFERFGQGPIVTSPYLRIHEAFEEQAARRPDAIAAWHLGDSISYQMLDRQANRLAARLRELGVRPGDNVALFIQRSIPMLVGILATLKAGAAYVPQDARIAPGMQMRYVAESSAAGVILTLSGLRHLVPEIRGVPCIPIDEFLSTAQDQNVVSAFPPKKISGTESPCFVLFTSGTTGKPNGVKVTHGNVCNILLTEPGRMGMRPGLKVSQILNIAFDMAAWEILGCLAHGATLVIRGKNIEETVKDVDIVIATPSILGSVDAENCRNVKYVAVAGEPCPRALADKWASFAKFYNSCGPTEVTIVNTMQAHGPNSERLTIGTPTPNNTVYILDEELKPCPIGEIGEMWAGGACVSDGYINDEELNNERYKPDPFIGRGMMFRTRDLGRWTQAGELEHFGRTDDQVKIRGFRVELDSVSAALESVPSCEQAVTLKLDSRNLAAFVRPASVDIERAREAVEKLLPYYCTPSLILALPDFPKTDRGKVDKRLLTALAVSRLETRNPENSEGVFL